VSQFQCGCHPLRPATDHCLGEPLPHQLANRARAPPSTPYGFESSTEIQGMLCGISFGFPKLFPIEGQIATCYAPVRRAPYVCYGTRTRLACVKHAASVRSEPGSNSRLNLVAWRKKSRDLHPRQPAKRIVDRSNLLRPLALENSNGFEQILAHRIGCQRARPPCPQKGKPTAKEYAKGAKKSQHEINDFHSGPQRALTACAW